MRTISSAAAIILLTTTLGYSATGGSVEVNKQTQALFRQYLIQQQVKPVAIQENVVVGGTIPETVTLAPVPAPIVQTAPSLATYQYVYAGDQIVLVDPSTRQIIQVLK
jgi:hypothetical protein